MLQEIQELRQARKYHNLEKKQYQKLILKNLRSKEISKQPEQEVENMSVVGVALQMFPKLAIQ